MKPALMLLSVAAAIAVAAGVIATRSRAGPISFGDLLARPRPIADHRIAYGPGPQQFGDLWLPKTPGPHRVVVLIHGGCWLADLPGLELMTYAADDLQRRGFAVWNIEYRRLGHAGGGYPGTFEDVAHGVDYLRTLAPTYGLDLHHLVLVGHSAGGHLALWDAARPRLPNTSALAGGDPLPIAGVMTLAGIDDLEAYRASGRMPAAGRRPSTSWSAPARAGPLTSTPTPRRRLSSRSACGRSSSPAISTRSCPQPSAATTPPKPARPATGCRSSTSQAPGTSS
jgi:acetyl esterase/lipase